MVIDKEEEDIDTIHEHRTLSKMKKILTTGLITFILSMFTSKSSAGGDKQKDKFFFSNLYQIYNEDFNRIIT